MMPGFFIRKKFTYPVLVDLGIVLVPSVRIIIDGDKSGASAASESGLKTEYCDSLFLVLDLELLSDFGLDRRLLDASHLWVNDLN